MQWIAYHARNILHSWKMEFVSNSINGRCLIWMIMDIEGCKAYCEKHNQGRMTWFWFTVHLVVLVDWCVKVLVCVHAWESCRVALCDPWHFLARYFMFEAEHDEPFNAGDPCEHEPENRASALLIKRKQPPHHISVILALSFWGFPHQGNRWVKCI